MATYDSEYYAERKKERYIRKELILPKDSGVVEGVESIMGKLGLSFNGYLVRALQEQIKRDNEFIENVATEWQIVVDELDIPRGRGNRYRSGYVFRHRPDTAGEKLVKKFETKEAAEEYIEQTGLYSKVQVLTARLALVKEYALLKRTVNKKTGEIINTTDPVWTSKEKPSEA